MKKIFLFLAGLGLLAALIGSLLGLSAHTLFAATRLTGSGKIVSRTQPVSAFEAVDVSRAVKVNIVRSSDKAVRIEADDNLLDKVIVRVKKGTLYIGVDKSVRKLSNSKIAVTVPYNEKLRALEASSAARICCEEPLVGREVKLEASSAATIRARVSATACDISASSAANIKADVTARECAVDASSAAQIELTGAADDCDASLSSASKFRGTEFVVKNYGIEASSGANAEIHCTEALDAEATSGALIRYAGGGRATISRSSGGAVQTIDE